jgi:hypothetical protein
LSFLGNHRSQQMIVESHDEQPKLRIHKGHKWLFVHPGELSLVIVDHNTTMGSGEVTAFDTGVTRGSAPSERSPSTCSARSDRSASGFTSSPHHRRTRSA